MVACRDGGRLGWRCLELRGIILCDLAQLMVEESRFAGISGRGAKWVLGLLLALILASLWPAFDKSTPGLQPVTIVETDPQAQKKEVGGDDLRLYKAIVDRMRAGERIGDRPAAKSATWVHRRHAMTFCCASF
jgi:hypothetical protein